MTEVFHKIKLYYTRSFYVYLFWVFLLSLPWLTLLYIFPYIFPAEAGPQALVDPTQTVYNNFRYDLKKLNDFGLIKYKPKNDFELMKLYPNRFSKGLLPPDCTDAKALGQQKALVQIFSVYLYFRSNGYSIVHIFKEQYFNLDEQAILLKTLDFVKSGQLSFDSPRISAMINDDYDQLVYCKMRAKRSINKWFITYFYEFKQLTGKNLTKYKL